MSPSRNTPFSCTATHDYEDPEFRLITKPIEIGDYAWIAARAFVAPGVKIGEGAVVGATASVYPRPVRPPGRRASASVFPR